jgi:tRNA (cytidine/uridine-2'-O-)-methyltransferase
MRVVLYQPQIPQNTGNIVRTCAVTGAALTLVHPLGFQIGEKQLRRAGLDYWLHVKVDEETCIDSVIDQAPGQVYFFSSHGKRLYTDVAYKPDDLLVFGSETEGLPAELHERFPDQFLRLPMLPEQRCLNLASASTAVIYEAWRQQGWPGADLS